MLFEEYDSEASEGSSYEEKGPGVVAKGPQDIEEDSFEESSEEDIEQRRVVKFEDRIRAELEQLLVDMQSLTDEYAFAAAWEKMLEINSLHKKNKSKLDRLGKIRGYEKFPSMPAVPRIYLMNMNRFLVQLQEQFDHEDFSVELSKCTKKDKTFYQRFKNKTLKGKDYPWKPQLERYAQQFDIWENIESDVEQDAENITSLSDEDSFVWSSSESESSDAEDEKDMFNRNFWVKTDKKKTQRKTRKLKPIDKCKKKIKDLGKEFELKQEEEEELLEELDENPEDEDIEIDLEDVREEMAVIQEKIEKYQRKEEKLVEKQNKEKVVAVEEKSGKWDKKRVRKELEKVLDSRSNLNRMERRQLNTDLKQIDEHSVRPQWSIITKVLLITNMLDTYGSGGSLPRGAWTEVVEICKQLVDLLTANPKYRLHVNGLRRLELTEEEKQKDKDAKEKEEKKNFSFAAVQDEAPKEEEEEEDDDRVEGLDEDYYWIKGNLSGYTRRLYDDMIQRFKKLDSSPESQDELNDQEELIQLGDKCCTYSGEIINHKMDTLRFRHLLAKLTYEKYDPEEDDLKNPNKLYIPFRLHQKTDCLFHVQRIFELNAEFDPIDFGAGTEKEIEEYTLTHIKINEEALLYTVHYLALHHKYKLAKNIISNIIITNTDKPTQALYNRTLARLSIAAFTCEDWRFAVDRLKSLFGTSKIKELLAQGRKNIYNKSGMTAAELAEELRMQEEEEAREVPEHTHIDIDLLESVHFISASFFEIRRILKGLQADSFRFRRDWEKRVNNIYLARPENTRETIVEAGSMMMKGNWRECHERLDELKCWDKFHYPQVIKDRVFKRAKEECLRCYLISSSKHFSNIRLSVLADKFEMDEDEVIQLCSKFIVEQDFRASIDLVGGFVVIHQTLPTQFEMAAQRFHHRLGSLKDTIDDVADLHGIRSVQGGHRSHRNNRHDGGRSMDRKNWGRN